MFRNVFAFVVVASALALTGCSKCSEQPAADAPAVETTAPVDAAAPADGAAVPADGAAPVDPASAPAGADAVPAATPAAH